VLARYHHLKPAALEKAATRWPKLQLDFMTIHASKGQQADYVIVVGLKEGSDGFPAPARIGDGAGPAASTGRFPGC
jgi:DNA helicase-4